MEDMKDPQYLHDLRAVAEDVSAELDPGARAAAQSDLAMYYYNHKKDDKQAVKWWLGEKNSKNIFF
jgi:hypothetical protein